MFLDNENNRQRVFLSFLSGWENEASCVAFTARWISVVLQYDSNTSHESIPPHTRLAVPVRSKRECVVRQRFL